MERYEFRNVYMCQVYTIWLLVFAVVWRPILRHVLEIILMRNCDGQHGLQLLGEHNHGTYPTKTAPPRTDMQTHTHQRTLRVRAGKCFNSALYSVAACASCLANANGSRVYSCWRTVHFVRDNLPSYQWAPCYRWWARCVKPK